MPNEENYTTETARNWIQYRPSRVDKSDSQLMENGVISLPFGLSDKDNVELILYTQNNQIAFYNVLSVASYSNIFTQTSYTDEMGNSTYSLNFNINNALSGNLIQPGRYIMVVNILRDEIGSYNGYKLYIDKISSSRTEARLVIVNPTDESLNDLYEFIEPSISRLEAQGLIEQTLRGSTEGPATLTSEQLANQAIYRYFDSQATELNSTNARLREANLDTWLDDYINRIIPLIRVRAIDIMASDSRNINIQVEDIMTKYIGPAIQQILNETRGLLNPDLNVD